MFLKVFWVVNQVEDLDKTVFPLECFQGHFYCTFIGFGAFLVITALLCIKMWENVRRTTTCRDLSERLRLANIYYKLPRLWRHWLPEPSPYNCPSYAIDRSYQSSYYWISGNEHRISDVHLSSFRRGQVRPTRRHNVHLLQLWAVFQSIVIQVNWFLDLLSAEQT